MGRREDRLDGLAGLVAVLLIPGAIVVFVAAFVLVTTLLEWVGLL